MRNRLFVGIFFLLQYSCGERPAQPPEKNILADKQDASKSKKHQTDTIIKVNNLYPEHWAWEDETSSFELDLIRNEDMIRGTYCAVAYKGDKIDCSEDTLSNYLTGTKVGEAYLVTFKSGFDYERGNDTALIIYNEKQKTLSWFRKTSNLIAYVPDHAILR